MTDDNINLESLSGILGEDKPKWLDEELKRLDSYSDEQLELLLNYLLQRRGRFGRSVSSDIYMRLVVAQATEMSFIGVPANTLVDDLIDQLVNEYSLLTSGPQGRQFSYNLVICTASGKQYLLNRQQKLYVAGVEPGSDIILIPNLHS